MHRHLRRYIAAVLCFAAVLSFLQIHPTEVRAEVNKYENTYVNTGDQRKDILGVALTQIGYEETGNNDTKYGTWYGLPYNPWCAMFVTWCARQADIPTDVLKRSARASPKQGYFDISCFYSNQKLPSPGDLFFTTGNTHVGLVYYVDGDYFYTIEGNSNPNLSTDGFCVISNRRPLSGYKFASPNYQGGDKEHRYVLKQEDAHPHKTYYQCTQCNDTHYTGNTVCVHSCKQCFSCGCNTGSAGYYLCKISDGVASVRPGHVASVNDKTRLGYIGDGMVVYVHGMSGGYACIEYDNLRGHVYSKYLTPYHPAPAAPSVTTDSYIYREGRDVTIRWDAPAYAEGYLLKIYRDQVLITEVETEQCQYPLSILTEGNYTALVCAGNRTGTSASSEVSFLVRRDYRVYYECGDGTGGPEPQQQLYGDFITIPDAVPSLDGYEFIGWNTDPEGRFAEYSPGSTVDFQEDTTLYAIWRQSDATMTELSIPKNDSKLHYLIGDPLDTQGLVLRVHYSDGTYYEINSGFTVSGFSSEVLGDVTLTVSYAGLSTDYIVSIVEAFPGDLNGDASVNSLDGLLLLRYLNGWDITIPLPENMDVNGDEAVNSLDGLILLRYLNGWDVTLK